MRLGCVGVRVGVSVRVGEKVTVGVSEAVGVGVSSSVVDVTVAGTVCVVVGGNLVGVGVVAGVTRGTRTNLARSVSSNPVPMMIGMAYLRSMSGNAAEVVTWFSPEYPSASNSFWKLAA